MKTEIRKGDTVRVTVPGDHYGACYPVVGKSEGNVYLDTGRNSSSHCFHITQVERIEGGVSLEQLLIQPDIRSRYDQHGRGLVQALYQLVNCASLDNLDYARSVLADMGIDPVHLGGKS